MAGLDEGAGDEAAGSAEIVWDKGALEGAMLEGVEQAKTKKMVNKNDPRVRSKAKKLR